MTGKEHRYEVLIEWCAGDSEGTSDYKSYSRDHLIKAPGKASIEGSSDPAFRGAPDRWNPEELLVAALSACHKLWYLHLAAVNGVSVTAYRDKAEGVMLEDAGKGGRFTAVHLNPHVTITADSDVKKAHELHKKAHELCFIANSVNFEVRHDPIVEVAS